MLAPSPSEHFLGKTVGLRVALVRRLVMKFSVVLHSIRDCIHIFNSLGVFEVRLPLNSFAAKELAMCLGPQTWFLVDSNIQIPTISPDLYSMGLFIVQAASARKEHLAWRDKSSYTVMNWFMWPPTEQEILDA